ncbi:hypothetical protein K678_07427 [Magnetospirillum fulvum MGU-K5]|uniref:Uncharacterized protein n=1 Tax=Magnetospirillum fulvum MGU-K5 TaxID=1316936 RepID=S9TIS0_MAGFU|nr:hypothetical protein K678_07427 [Magnetospirillum fulvum MGU-K5]
MGGGTGGGCLFLRGQDGRGRFGDLGDRAALGLIVVGVRGALIGRRGAISAGQGRGETFFNLIFDLRLQGLAQRGSHLAEIVFGQAHFRHDLLAKLFLKLLDLGVTNPGGEAFFSDLSQFVVLCLLFGGGAVGRVHRRIEPAAGR